MLFSQCLQQITTLRALWVYLSQYQQHLCCKEHSFLMVIISVLHKSLIDPVVDSHNKIRTYNEN